MSNELQCSIIIVLCFILLYAVKKLIKFVIYTGIISFWEYEFGKFFIEEYHINIWQIVVFVLIAFIIIINLIRMKITSS